MSVNGPRRLGDLLQTGDISRLRTEAAERRELAVRVRSELPAAESEHVVSAHMDDEGRLVVGMDSAAWAARLRYSMAELLGRRLKVRVAVAGERIG
jgi:hypothetical protein